MLIDPSLFIDIEDFKNDIGITVKELKSLPKAQGFKEIYYPREQSFLKMMKNIKKDVIEIDDQIYKELFHSGRK